MNPLEETPQEHENMSPGSQPAQVREERTRPPRSKSSLWILLAIVGIGIIGIGAYLLMQPSGPVAVVNGEEISRQEYDARLSQARTVLSQSGADLNDATLQQQMEQQVIENLVTQELLLQEARSSGITVTDAEVAEVVDQNRQQLQTEDAFQAALSEQGFTEESFREAVRTQLLIEKLLEARLNLEAVTATEEEVQALYDQVATGVEDAPTLETVRAQVEAEVVAQKRQQLIADFVQALRQESEVEILI